MTTAARTARAAHLAARVDQWFSANLPSYSGISTVSMA